MTYGMDGWCKEPNKGGNGSKCVNGARNDEDRTAGDCISRQAAIDALLRYIAPIEHGNGTATIRFLDADVIIKLLSNLPSAQPERMRWIPCSERLPKVNQWVLLSTNDGAVSVGRREKPDIIWQVTEQNGRKHWVYDPEAYTDDIDKLPKSEDISFEKSTGYADGYLAVTSPNYDSKFSGVVAWMPLPEPYREAPDD